MTAIKFVSDAAVGADVRLDLHPNPPLIYVSREGFDLGRPQFIGEPGGIGGEDDLRTIEFKHMIRAPKPAALARLSALSRELLRDTNWLLFQLSTDSMPVWFKTYRSQVGELSLEHVHDRDGNVIPDFWQISVSLAADPYARGERVTIPAFTLKNDPTANTGNPAFYQLPEILGDAPASLVFRTISSRTWHGFRPLVNVTALEPGIAYPKPVVWRADAFALGADTGAAVTSATRMGGKYVPVSFSTTPGMATRLSGDVPEVPLPGRYRVFARVSRSDTTSTFAMRLGAAGFGTTFSFLDTARLDRTTSPAADFAAHVDLGVHQFPTGSDLVDSATQGNQLAPHIAFQAQRLSGTGSLRIDGFVLIPVHLGDGVQSRTLALDYRSWGPSDVFHVEWNGEAESIRPYGFGVGLVSATIPEPAGQFLEVVPGATNIVHALAQTNASTPDATVTGENNSDAIADTIEFVAVSYQPRYLYLGDA